MSNSFKRQTMGNHINLGAEWVVKRRDAILTADLWWLIYGFNVDSDTIREIRVFGVVAIQVSHPLLVAPCLLPCSYEL